MWILETVKVGNIVHGIIFIQAFLSAISVVMIYALCCKICKNVIVSFLLAVMYGFSATMLVITWTPESFIYANFTLVLMCFVCYPFINGEKKQNGVQYYQYIIGIRNNWGHFN